MINRRDLFSVAAAGVASAAFGRRWVSAETAGATHAASERRVTLLHFTDTHAQLETHPEYLPGADPEIQMMGGFARLKTAIERERAAAGDACFVVDTGDEFQGSGPAAWSRGEVIVEPLNALNADVFLPGNWEPAYGPDRFKELMARLKAPVACYNFHDQASGDRLFPPALTISRGGVKVSFVGITDILASKRQPPVEFAGMDTTRVEGLREFVQALREKETPDVVVAMTHTGLTIARQLARDIPEFDVVLSAHTHERTEHPILEGKVIVVEPGSMGSFLGRLDLTLKPGGGIAGHSWQLIPILADKYPEDSEVKRLVDQSLAPHRQRMNEVLGTTETTLLRYDVLETNADNFITDAVRETAKGDIGISNGFRFGIPIVAGTVTEADLWNLLPMDTRMKRGWVTGAELKAYLEQELELVFSKDPMKLSGGWGPRASGMTMHYRSHAPNGQRLRWVKVNDKPVEDSAHYTIAGCEREGEPLDVVCRHKGTHDAQVLPIMIHAALRQYLKARSPDRPAPGRTSNGGGSARPSFSARMQLSPAAGAATNSG